MLDTDQHVLRLSMGVEVFLLFVGKPLIGFG